MNRLLGTLLLASAVLAVSAQSLQEKMLAKMLKKAAEMDESMVQPINMYLDGSTESVKVITDGTKTFSFECLISDETSKLKKGYAKKEHYYTFLVKVTSAKINQDMVDTEIFSKNGSLTEWSDAGGSISFELDQIEVLRHLDNNVDGETFEMEATLISNSSNGQALLSKGQFSVSSSPNGKWVKANKEEWLESYRSGRLAEYNTDAPIWKRMLAYSKNQWPQADIMHLKVSGSGVTNDDRLNTEIFVTFREEGVCTYYAVSVWEDRYEKTLSNYVPQYASNPDCEGLDGVRNVN